MIYAVLEEIESALIEELFGNNNQLILNYRLSIDEIIYDIAQNYKRNKKYLDILLGKHGDPQFVDKIKTHLKDLIRPLLITVNNTYTVNPDYYLEYLTNGLIGMLTYWQQNDNKLSIEKFLNICKEIIIPPQLASYFSIE